MNQNHNENKEVHSKSLIYCTGIGRCPSTDHSYIKDCIYKGNTPWIEQFKRRKFPDFQGLLFVFEAGEDFL